MLQVPVPQLEPFVRARHAHYDADYVSADPTFVHAHVTALGPFLPVVDAEAAQLVAKIAASVEPFEFTLARVATFPNGLIHLVPEPDGPFRELTSRLVAAFPECRPYEGRFEPVPHLTLDLRSASVSEESTRALLGDAVPAACRAERLDLAWYEPGCLSLLDSWPLGGSYGGPMSTDERVLANFLAPDGSLRTIPSKRSKLLVVLDHVAQAFEPGRVYPEAEVNEILQRFHPDYAALRRYLVDDDFLTRREGYYWRSGGTFAV